MKRTVISIFSVFAVFIGLAFILPMEESIPVAKKQYVELQVSKTNTWVEERLSKMTLKEKIGQFFMIAAYSNKSEAHFQMLDSLVVQEGIGGLIFFQGERDNLVKAINRFQLKADIPLLVGMDAEWGVQMRLFGEERFPYNYTIGAADDSELTEKLSEMMGQECRELGIHINFAPVVDVNSNPNNPIIGFRSYGENPKKVSDHVVACVKGMESQSVLTSIKHFPGHGDTDVDSHKDLPVVNNSYAHINAIDFFPFRSGIRAGASSVMVGHLDVPALDASGTPSSLSEPIIKGYLQNELSFKGLVISDALGMKAVADRYGKTEVVVKAFQAGCDILLFPESVHDAIVAIEMKVNKGEITTAEIDNRCRKVLLAKYKSIIKPSEYKTYTESEIELTKKLLYEKAITVVKNEGNLLPIQRFDQRIAHVSIGSHTETLEQSMELVAPVDHFHFYSGEEAVRRFKEKFNDYDIIITSFHAKSVRASNDYGMPKEWRRWMSVLPEDKKNILILFGNPFVLGSNVNLSKLESVVVAYENHKLALDRVGQFVMGTFPSQGKLPMTVNENLKGGKGIVVKWGGRLKESQPEEVGVNPKKLEEIDEIVKKSIAAGAFPGCQIVVAVEGKVIYRKSFGHHTYDNNREVINTDVYDIASITKIAASTLSLMHLNSEGKFHLNTRLENYLPDLTANTSYSRIKLKDMMAHQARLTPWIPFYVKTIKNNVLDSSLYSNHSSTLYCNQVTDNLWMKGSYTDEMYSEILKTPLRSSRKYKYSDIGYYFVKKIIEKQTNRALDEYVLNEFYKPMGLNTMCYHPLKYFSLSQIPPTENDKIYRKQLVHGHVHDPGSAMMGGVGGHAGVFSSASDLASLMQLFLNKGMYGGVNYISPDVVEEYTKYQYYPKNRRGAGFDKPTTNHKGGPTCSLASASSFGHSGFTGTLAWSDPEYDMTFVFLSNRVYPDAENWKIVRMNIRTDIQQVIYEALLARN